MDWIAGLLELLGLWKIGNKNKIGFYFNILCGLCWISYVIISKSTYGLLLVVIPAIVINIRNIIKWRRSEEEKTNNE